MSNKITQFVNELFGPQKWEIDLAETKDPKIIKLMSTVKTIRFIVFPISATICVIGMILDLITTISNYISKLGFTLFEFINDSLWLDLGWFGLTELNLNRETIRIAAEKEGKTELQKVQELIEEVNAEES